MVAKGERLSRLEVVHGLGKLQAGELTRRGASYIFGEVNGAHLLFPHWTQVAVA